MSAFDDPFNPEVKLGCGCGRHSDRAAHDADLAAGSSPETHDTDVLASRAVDQAVMRALFPHDAPRRRFLKAVGANTAMAAVAQFFPLGAAREAFAQGKGGIEEFGDGIMSAIDFKMDLTREPDPKGDRVKIVMSGKYLQYKTY